MKILFPLIAAGMLAAALPMQASAQQIMVVPSDQLPGLTTMSGKYTVLYPKRPDWTYRIDRSVLTRFPSRSHGPAPVA